MIEPTSLELIANEDFALLIMAGEPFTRCPQCQTLLTMDDTETLGADPGNEFCPHCNVEFEPRWRVLREGKAVDQKTLFEDM